MTAFPPQVKTCLHCGNEIRSPRPGELFCCSGCHYVYDMIHQEGLDHYYELQEGKTPPVASTPFQQRSYERLHDFITHLEKKSSPDKSSLEATFSVQGISCVGCVWLLEKVFKGFPGAMACDVDATAGEMTLRWQKGEANLLDYAKKVQSFGYILGIRNEQGARESQQLVRRLGLCGAFSMNAMLFAIPTYLGMEKTFTYAPLFARLLLVFSTLSVIVGGAILFVVAGKVCDIESFISIFRSALGF